MHIAWGEVENGCGGIVTDEQGYPPHQEAQGSGGATITRRTVIRFGGNEKHQIIQPFSACFLYKRLTQYACKNKLKNTQVFDYVQRLSPLPM